jgi:hypothetical protein
VINGTMAILILVLALVGIVGFAGLLMVGLRMWGDERAAKRAAKAPEPGAPFAAETASAVEAAALPTEVPQASPVPAAPEAPEAPAPGVVEAAAEPLPPEPASVSLQSDTAAPSPGPEPAAPPAPKFEGKTTGLRLPFLDRLNRGPAVQEILRVVRDPVTGQVIIAIAGKPCTNFHDIQNAANEQAFMMAYRLLQAFSENALAAPPPAEDAEAALQLVEPPQPVPVVYRAAELPPPEMPSMKPLEQFRKMRSKQPPATKYVIKSITEQIEDHLQDKIARTSLARRGVHVRSELQGNAVFLLDGKAYPSVDDVPDPEVRQVIREAISEWEKKK